MEQLGLAAFFLFCLFTSGFSQGSPMTGHEQNLKLTIEFEKASGAMDFDRILLFLENRSATEQYQVIMPGDGSESAWREPYIHFSAEMENEKGEWMPVPQTMTMRCGLFDAEWQDDARTIKGRQKIEIYRMATVNILAGFRIPADGKLRLQAQYDYQRGAHPKQHFKAIPEGYHEILDKEIDASITDIPAFKLESDPIEFSVKANQK